MILHVKKWNTFLKNKYGEHAFWKMQILEKIIATIISIEFEILAFATEFQSCKVNCTNIDGHIPYFYEVYAIHHRLYQNNDTIDKKEFPIFDMRFHGQGNGFGRNIWWVAWSVNQAVDRSFEILFEVDEREMRFFISSKYDYLNKIWYSGYFKILDNQWTKSELGEDSFPIEGNGQFDMNCIILVLIIVIRIFLASAVHFSRLGPS